MYASLPHLFLHVLCAQTAAALRHEEYHLWKCSLHLWACVLTSKYRRFCIAELNYVPFSTLTSRKTSKQMMWGLDIFAVCVCNWNKSRCCCSSKTVYQFHRYTAALRWGAGAAPQGGLCGSALCSSPCSHVAPSAARHAVGKAVL